MAYAGLIALGIPAYETTGQPDIWLVMPDDQTFVDICGGQAAACVTYANDPVFVYFRRALFYSDWRSTISHEGISYGHVFGEHEQYDDVNFRCRSILELLQDGPGLTVMSCGTGLWEPQVFDVSTVHATVLPRSFNGGLLITNTFMYYGGSDSRTRRIAVFFETYTGYIYWTGFYLPARQCNDPYVCESGNIPDPGTCQGVLLGHENALPGSWGRNLVMVNGSWRGC